MAAEKQNDKTTKKPKEKKVKIIERQRLALFLDGTWNTQDDSTNVRHAFTLTKEGVFEKKVDENTIIRFTQKRYYDPGVGTGVLDSITGGGFGIGLDANVRQAYNWLVDNYNDNYEDGSKVTDEIYIFGFSRGAFTARSLMGFIGACGLMKRGAPLMVSQLWKGYNFIAQNREHDNNDWWAETFKRNKYKFRRITRLNKSKPEKNLNDTERLVAQWCRRVDISYMGIFDTVGAMGWEALGLPGITSKLDKHHNPYPSSILKKCRHALAIDENRTSFRLTPMLNYVRNSSDISKTEGYKDKISQCWFVGAHANIGGGYPDNLLATRPLEWIIEGANKVGLETRELLTSKLAARNTDVRDSYAEFAAPLWANLIRAKRNYRPIVRADDVRSGYSLREISEEIDDSVIEIAEKSTDYAPANLLTHVRRFSNKKLKAIVKELAETYPDHAPPNLLTDIDHFSNEKLEKIIKEFEKKSPEYKPPKLLTAVDKSPNGRLEKIFKDRKARQEWPGGGLKAKAILIAWCVLAALGFAAFSKLFFTEIPPSSWLGYSILTALFAIIDWGEARANLRSAINPSAVIPRVTHSVLQWLRLVGMLAFFTGIGAFIVTFWNLGWDGGYPFTDAFVLFLDGLKLMSPWYLVPVVSSVTVLALGVFAKEERTKGMMETLLASAIAIVILVVFGLIVSGFGGIGEFVIGGWFSEDPGYFQQPLSNIEILSGKLLLIQFLLFVFLMCFQWVGNRMGKAKADLGSLVALQTAYSPARINKLLNDWSFKLNRKWLAKPTETSPKGGKLIDTTPGWLSLKEILRETLWRDIIGFTPIYTIAFAIILWIGANVQEVTYWAWLGESSFFPGIPWWLAITGITIIVDLLESAIHLRHIKIYRKQKLSALLTAVGFLATFIKFCGFIAGLLLSLGIFGTLAWEIVLGSGGRWRWTLAFGGTYFMVLLILPLIISLVWPFSRNKQPKKKQEA